MSSTRIRRPIFVFDTETTGLTNADRLVEIAVAELPITSQRTGLLSFSSLIHPKGVKIPRAATRIHGITNLMLQDAPHFRAAWKGFEEYIKHASSRRGRPILVAHNLPFDLRFIKAELSRLSLSLPPWDFADSLRDVAHVVWPGEKGNLAALVNRLSIVNEEAHRALCDVEATCEVLKKADAHLAIVAAKENNDPNSDIIPGDCIYELVLKASEKHNKLISPFWRIENISQELSMSDSVTEASTSRDICNVSISADSDMQTMRSNSENAEEFNAQTGFSCCLSLNCAGVQGTSSTCGPRLSESDAHQLCENCANKSPFSNQKGSAINSLRRQRSATHRGSYIYFTPNGLCYHMRPECSGLRTAFHIQQASSPRQGLRPCQICCI
jgi:DNA polymerase III epsilon subunit family exonuclease